jgi:hypothetical protein
MAPHESLIDLLIEAGFFAKVVDQGRRMVARSILLDVGTIKLGQPGKDTLDSLHVTDDVMILRAMIRRVRHVNSWQELLAGFANP